MKKALLFLCTTLLAAAAQADRSQAPVDDAIILTRVTLNRLELDAPVTRTAGLLPEKKEHLPLSVQLYLKPSGQLNSLHPALQRAAQKVRKLVAPGAKQKEHLRDSGAVAAAVWSYLNDALPVDASLDPGSQPRIDWRLAWDKAGEILASGKADADGRVLVEVALLRALKVPARTAWAQGRLVSQYWVALAAAPGKAQPKPKKGKAKKSNAPKAPLGYWALMDPGVHDEEVEAWSLDNGALKRLHWAPEQELSVTRLGWHRKVYAAGDSLTARAALDALAQSGRWLPEAASPTASALTPSASLTSTAVVEVAPDLSGAGTWYVLTQESFRLQTQGSLAPAEAVDLLSPYRPQLPQWGRECPPRVRALELEGQALWSDRPERLRLRAGNKPRDEWQSPPPALGVLHYLSFGLRRPGSVLQAQRSADAISGVILRADNLSPRAGWTLQLAAQGVSTASQTLVVPADGHFSLTLTAQEQAEPVLELRNSGDEAARASGDLQLLPRP
jgi:hypothetical protein